MRIIGCVIAATAAVIGVAGVTSGQSLGAADVDRLPATRPVAVVRYGPGNLQYGELRLPRGTGPFPVVVVIHGGCWTKGFATLRNTAPLASAITDMGYATWNVEYRQVGDSGGGWPGSFLDWGNATDFLRTLARTYPIDLDRVGVIGHSAGAYAAVWVAARSAIPPGSEVATPRPLPVKLAIAVDGPTELTPFVGMDKDVCGKPVIVPLMGGTPAQVPHRYRIADVPDLHRPAVDEALIASTVLQPRIMAAYRRAGAKAGQRVDVLTIGDSGHFEPIALTSDVWRSRVRPFLKKVLARLKG